MTTASLPESAIAANLLFIEDNPHKRSRVVEFLGGLPHRIAITEAHSFSSGCQKFETGDFNLILADVSLPTFDKTLTDSGGRFRAFAGLEIARKLARNRVASRVAFITQYRSFSEKGTSYSFDELADALRKVSGDRFLGMVFYDGSQSAWKDQLGGIISRMSDENPNS
jgi:CheY-like chemotaxis protein